MARRNFKDMKVTSWGIRNEPVMFPDIPKTQEALETLKKTVYQNDAIYGKLVSFDAKSTLIQAVFIKDPQTGEEIDYKLLFDKLNTIVDLEQDANTSIRMSGNPVLYGWVYSYFKEMMSIFALTVGVVILLLFAYFKSPIGVVRPLISGVVSTVWGLGLAQLLGYNLDPLILVIPFLISARVVSHSVQMVRRFDEEFYRHRDVKKACIESTAHLLAPGLLGTITDALGILVVLVAPIPILTKLGLMGAYWVLSIILSVLILDPIILSYLPAPMLRASSFKEAAWIANPLAWLGGLPFKPASRRIIITVSLIVFAVAAYYAKDLRVGDVHPGSPILWPDSEYNQATASINAKYPGTDQLFVILEGQKEGDMYSPEAIKLMEDFQWHMNSLPEIGGSLSIASITPSVNAAMHYGDPKWGIQALHDPQYMAMLTFMFSQGCEPGEMDRYMDRNNQLANIIMFVKNHKGPTIEKVVDRAETFIAANPSNKVEFKMAGGLIGILAAANDVIARSETLAIVLALLVVFVTCSITYRSFVAGMIFVVPLAVSNYLTFAYMAWKGMGMNVNTLPVTTLGIGLGVDYGIYVVSRMVEEYAVVKDYRQASVNAVSTSGGAVLFTGTTLIASVIFWYFLSSLRFQAEMGLLLAIWMFISMIGGLILIPTIVAIFKPKFIARGVNEEAPEAAGTAHLAEKHVFNT
jgi:predicted RND superfamily exporter protein